MTIERQFEEWDRGELLDELHRLREVLKFKIFIWEGDGVLTDYTNGMIVVAAENLEAAHREIEKVCNYCQGSYPPVPTETIDLADVRPKAWLVYGGG